MYFVPLSALQHYVFCPRQCALIHNEQIWSENFLTAQGKALHERVDKGEPETRHGIRYERSVHVSAEQWGLTGIVDMVEYDTHSGNIKPVEYKRGKPKNDHSDQIQLCAQALCLEEMTGQNIPEAALWYAQTRHRQIIPLTPQLRQETIGTIEQVRKLLESGETPPPQYSKHCKACSLVEECRPQLSDYSRQYTARLFQEQDYQEADYA